jgi:hypothetical protein
MDDNAKRITIVIADDHAIVRAGLKQFVADQAEERGHAAKAGHVRGGVPGPAESGVFAGVIQYRYRRFGGDARRISHQVLVGDHVSEDEHARAGNLLEDLCEG